jgi:hypothetical protein
MQQDSTNEAAQSKTRIQIDLLPGELERMNIVMRMTGLNTRKDLFNNALALFEWAVTEVARGKEIGSVTSGGDITALTMPALKAAAHYGRRHDFADVQRVVDQAVEEDKSGPQPRNIPVFRTG